MASFWDLFNPRNILSIDDNPFSIITNWIGGNGWKTNTELNQENDQKQKELYDLNNQNITKGFTDMLNNGSSGNDLLSYALNNPDWAKANGDLISPFINDIRNRENMSANLKAQMDAFKENGLNPLNVVGNIGSLGSSSLDIGNPSQSLGNSQNNTADGKILSAIILMLARLIS